MIKFLIILTFFSFFEIALASGDKLNREDPNLDYKPDGAEAYPYCLECQNKKAMLSRPAMSFVDSEFSNSSFKTSPDEVAH